jgi:hypothetical protein
MARINFFGEDKRCGYGAGVTGVADFMRAGEVDPRSKGATPAGG